MAVCAWVWKRQGSSSVSLYLFPFSSFFFLFCTGLIGTWDLSIVARLTSHRAPVFHQSLPPQHWDCKLPHLITELRPSPLHEKQISYWATFPTLNTISEICPQLEVFLLYTELLSGNVFKNPAHASITPSRYGREVSQGPLIEKPRIPNCPCPSWHQHRKSAMEFLPSLSSSILSFLLLSLPPSLTSSFSPSTISFFKSWFSLCCSD